MDFSVLMTVYKKDDPNFFIDALKSVSVSQIKKPNEIVIVCDGPLTQDLNEKIVAFIDSIDIKTKIIRLKENIGQGGALNIGLSNCQYEYVARMDSDDISLPLRFYDQMKYLEEYPKVDVLSCYVREFDNKDNSNIRRVPVAHASILNYAKKRSPINHAAVIFKKTKVQAVGAYSSLVQCQDYKLWVDLLLNNSTFHNLPKVLMDVRLGDGYGRKKGKSYLKEELYLHKYFLNSNFINKKQYYINIFIRFFRILPTPLIDLFYRRILRGS